MKKYTIIIIIAILAASCAPDNFNALNMNVTLPNSTFQNRDYYAIVDTDTDSTNGTVKQLAGTTPGTLTFNIFMTDITAGTYYIYVWVDNDGTGTSFDSNNDARGFFGGGTPLSIDPPGSANFIIPESGTVTATFDIGTEAA